MAGPGRPWRRLMSAEAGQGVGFSGPVADLPEQGQGAADAPGGLLVAALPQVNGGQGIEQEALADLVAGVAQQVQGLLQVPGGFGVAAELEVEDADVAEGADLAGAVAGLAVQGQSLLHVRGGLRLAALAQAQDTEVDQRLGLGGAVACLACGEAGVAVDSDRLGVVTAVVEVTKQGRCQAGGMAGPAVRSGVHSDRDQGGPFGIQPGQRRRGVGHRRRRAGGRKDAGPPVPLARQQRVHRGGGGAQVIAEQAGQRHLPVVLGVADGGEFAGIGAQQIMHAVPARPGELSQVRAGQHIERALGLPDGAASQCSRGVAVKVQAGVQAQEPEQASGGRVEVPAGPGKHGPHGGPGIPRSVQQVQSPLVISKLAHQARPAGQRTGQRRARRPPAAPAAADCTGRPVPSSRLDPH